MIKKISVDIKVAKRRYLMLPLYVSFLTLNKPVNHLPILVSGIKRPMHIAKTKDTPKLIPKFTQSMLAPWLKEAAKHKKKHTGMLQSKL